MTEPAIGQERVSVSLTVNGQDHIRDVDARMLLIDFLRDQLGLTGSHIGCDSTSCGACTVLLDGAAVKSCTIFAAQASSSEIQTVESLAEDDQLSDVQEQFHAHHSLQCGYCTSGMLMSATALLRRNPRPSRQEIERGIAGNLCRCTGYRFIVDAIETAATNREPVA